MISPEKFGVSFSLKQCRNFGIDPHKTLDWLINEAGFRRFRLMTYWNEHEKQPGAYDFSALDWQLDAIAKAGGVVTLCLGARQPRWPENHWPDWAWELPKAERTQALLEYIAQVVECYRSQTCIVSYQLENEALLVNFGRRPEVDRARLRQELQLVKELDPKRPVIMTTSDQFGLPWRRPVPDIIGFSYYHVAYDSRHKKYRNTRHFAGMHRWRGRLGRILRGKPAFIHELQLEPWGPTAIWKMSTSEQDKSMSPALIAKSLARARKTKLHPVDLWGAEWWYWRLAVKKDPSIWQAVLSNLNT